MNAARTTKLLSSGLQPDVDYSHWVCVYPAYIDKIRTIAKGRRIPKEKAVTDPSAPEVFGVVQSLGFDCVLEADKSYSRDCWSVGRIRLRMFDADHKPLKEAIANRKDLFVKIAARIPPYRERVGQKKASGASGSKKVGKSKKKGKK